MSDTPLLPTELWLEIASHVEHKELPPLLLLNQSLHALYSPLLYRRLIIKGPDQRIGNLPENPNREESKSKFILAGPATSQLLQRLESSAKTRAWVRHCQISNFTTKIAWISWKKESDEMSTLFHAFQALMCNIFTLVGSFPSLKDVRLFMAEIPSESLYYICTQPHLSLSVSIHGVTFFGTNEVEPDARLTATKVSITSQLRHVMPSFVTLTLGCSLRELALGTEADMHLRRFYQAHMDYPGASLPQLEVLAVSWILREYLPFFKSTPNLIELRLERTVRMSLGGGSLHPSLLPKLQRFHGHNSFVPFFVTGRPIRTISTRSSSGGVRAIYLGWEDNLVFGNISSRFGSTVDVRDLTWSDCNSDLDLLYYLVTQNSNIARLEMTPILAYNKDELRARLESVTSLKELHTLHIRCLEHVPCEKTLSWEREQCEWLQNEGSGSLVSISFSVLIDWNRRVGSSVWVPSGIGMEVCALDEAGKIGWDGRRQTPPPTVRIDDLTAVKVVM